MLAGPLHTLAVIVSLLLTRRNCWPVKAGIASREREREDCAEEEREREREREKGTARAVWKKTRERERERGDVQVDLPSPSGGARGRPGEVAVGSSGLAGWTFL